MIMVGFQGTSLEDSEVKALLPQIETGHIGGIIEFSYNIQSPLQVKTLNQWLKEASPTDYPLLIGIDQEGGKVQRLNSSNGYGSFLSAQEVYQNHTPSEALLYYENLAEQLKEAEFNVNFAPVVDLEGECPVIGKLKRSYHADPLIIAQYAQSFVKAHRKHYLLTSLKHFPGHGLAQGDTHKGLVDITKTHDQKELDPFYTLIEQGYADMIMVGHLTHKEMDTTHPATLSRSFIDPLLRQKGYEGVVISDDLHMGAILQFYSLEEIIVRAINAEVDILMFSKNPAAAGNYAPFQFLQNLTNIHTIIFKALEEKTIKIEQIQRAYDRIMKLKNRLKSFS